MIISHCTSAWYEGKNDCQVHSWVGETQESNPKIELVSRDVRERKPERKIIIQEANNQIKSW